MIPKLLTVCSIGIFLIRPLITHQQNLANSDNNGGQPMATETGTTNESSSKKPLKILVYSPSIGWSHMQFMGQLADALADAGHEVHFLRFTMNDRYVGLKDTEKAHKVHDLRPVDPSSMDVLTVASIGNPFNSTGFPTFMFYPDLWKQYYKIFEAVCQELVQNEAMIARLEAEHFDVGIAEIYDPCPHGYLRRVGVRTQLAALAVPLFQIPARRFGIPTFSSYVTNVISPMPSAPNMGFWDRLVNFYNDLYEYFYVTDLSIKMQQPIVRRAFGPDFPALDELLRNISLLFVNSNPFFEMPRPFSHKIVNIGGLVPMTAKPLDPAINQLLDASPRGAVLVSFGSVVDPRGMDEQLKTAFLRAFAAFPDYTFLWKFEIRDEAEAKMFARIAPNVRAIKWMDQKSILLHPKLRAFLTHCGQNSLTEAARAGMPIVTLPLFGDQLYNTLVARLHGMSVPLDLQTLRGPRANKLIAAALDKVLHQPQYRAAAQLLAKKLALTPFSAQERLVKWVEFAAQFTDLNELNLPWERELGLLAYYSVDVILFTLSMLGIGLAAVLWVIRRIVRRICCSPAKGFSKRTTKLKDQ